MEEIANILLWIGMISGGFLVLLLLISIVSGLDFDGDVDFDTGGDADSDAGGMGLIKSVLTLFSVGSFTARAVLLNSDWSWPVAITTGIIGGVVAIFLLTQLLRFLLKQQEEGNYQLWEAIDKTGKVYVPIPANGLGRITLELHGTFREIPARSATGKAIATNSEVLVTEAGEEYLLVVEMPSEPAKERH